MRIKNWEKYQHYKERNPPWIKLHYELLTSKDWVCLDDASRVLAVACMLIASRNGGEIPEDTEYVRRVAYLNGSPDFSPLIRCGFIVLDDSASNMLASARPEAEAEAETEAETTLSSATALDPGDSPSSLQKNGVPVATIIAHLNAAAQRDFKPAVKATRSKIKARWAEGHRLDDFIAVIDHKAEEWLCDAKMQQYLRPETLFGTKFESYLVAAKAAGVGIKPTKRWE